MIKLYERCTIQFVYKISDIQYFIKLQDLRDPNGAMDPIAKVSVENEIKTICNYCRSGVAWQSVPRHVSRLEKSRIRVFDVSWGVYWFLDYRPRARKDLRDAMHDPLLLIHFSQSPQPPLLSLSYIASCILLSRVRGKSNGRNFLP